MRKTAIILSGGLGTRLRPFTNIIPKPLLPIGEKAILEIQIEQLKKAGFTDIVLATNYKSDYIKNFFGDGSRYGVNLVVSKEEKPLGTAGPLKLVEPLLNSYFLVMNGDILTDLDFSEFYEFALRKSQKITVAIKKILMPYQFGNIEFDGDLVTNIIEKPSLVTYALAGIYIMHPNILQDIPSNTYYGMDSLILKLLKNKENVVKYEMNAYWLDVGREDDYSKAQKLYQK